METSAEDEANESFKRRGRSSAIFLAVNSPVENHIETRQAVLMQRHTRFALCDDYPTPI